MFSKEQVVRNPSCSSLNVQIDSFLQIDLTNAALQCNTEVSAMMKIMFLYAYNGSAKIFNQNFNTLGLILPDPDEDYVFNRFNYFFEQHGFVKQ